MRFFALEILDDDGKSLEPRQFIGDWQVNHEGIGEFSNPPEGGLMAVSADLYQPDDYVCAMMGLSEQQFKTRIVAFDIRDDLTDEVNAEFEARRIDSEDDAREKSA